MIKVSGAVTEIVPIPDLGDKVYYKQEKTYSEAQYHKSLDLQREIQRGRLRVISRTPEDYSNFKPPESVDMPEVPGATGASIEVSSLLEHIKSLEKKLEENSKPQEEKPIENPKQNELILKLMDKIEDLESKLAATPQADNTKLLEAIERLEKKKPDNDNPEILQKLEDIVSRAPTATGGVPKDTRSAKQIEEDIYVPKIKVEDGTSHIKLKTRTVESGSSVNSAAEALKKLRQKNKS